MRFPYVQRGLAPMPMLPFQLVRYRTGKIVDALGLVDSGATLSVLPDMLAMELGLDWGVLDKSVNLGGRFAGHEARLVAVGTRIKGFEETSLIFAWTKAPDAPLILGQVDFFVRFNVCFFGSATFFEITEN